MFGIYSVDPAPWGEDYRLVEMFDDIEHAKRVLQTLEKVNISFNFYKIIEWPEERERNDKEKNNKNCQRNQTTRTRGNTKRDKPSPDCRRS